MLRTAILKNGTGLDTVSRLWIRDYQARTDVFSLSAHRALFDGFCGEKVELVSREAIAAFE
jgi:hypothetical protein